MALQTLSPLSAADTWILEEQWSDPEQAIKDGALLSVLLSFGLLAAEQK